MKIVTQLTDWPTPLHRASINSFGYGGANAHAILESVDNFLPGYNTSKREVLPVDQTRLYVLPFSASTTQSLEARITSLAQRFNSGETYDFGNLCHTLADRRTQLSKKGFLLTTPSTAKGDFSLENLVTPKKIFPRLGFGFLFTGQGAQWPQMGKELLENYVLFSNTIDYLDSILQKLPEPPSWAMRDALLEPAATSKVGEAAFSQPLCTAVQIGIVKLLRAWGVEPTVVAGHSSGEIAAAYAAGLLSEAHAMIIAFYRGHVVSKITSKGCMLALGMGPEDAKALLDRMPFQKELCVACVNSPESVTISGTMKAIDGLVAELQGASVFTRKLATGGRAYHSFLMEEVGAEYETLINRAITSLPMPTSGPDDPSAVRFFSSVGRDTDALACFSRETHHSIRPSYWRANLENPVQFSTAIKNIIGTGQYHLLEIGPHSALQLPVKQIRSFSGVPEDDLPYTPTLVRGKDADVCLKSLAGQLSLSGHFVDFLAVNSTDFDGKKSNVSVVHDLPPYHWSYTQLLWNEPRSSIDLRNRKYVRHELLGSEMPAANGIERCWRNIFKPAEVPWLLDHKVSHSTSPLSTLT